MPAKCEHHFSHVVAFYRGKILSSHEKYFTGPDFIHE